MQMPRDACDVYRSLAAGFLVAASFFLPAIGSSISFWPVAFFGFFGALAGAAWPTLRRSASIRSTTLPAAGLALAVIGCRAPGHEFGKVAAIAGRVG
jgi:hypothetical protein